ncbi:class I adenylate-forming enzyme family protein [Blastomonas sp. UPD001]|jgi:cyclohexanecarboxylate-CoA ligase|uniref:class I adenylate-forming enzyme family protein n=1 Tax=Blastomonas sp. UPD001 TaxID=2217673 RepID=UPI000E356051|nr:class I adenylate-forming enzyme family protein [Blastomonas sp. UPD001]
MFLTPAKRIADYQARGWWEGKSVDVLFRQAVTERGDALALVDPLNRETLDGCAPERLNWTELDARVDAMAAALIALGLERDDVVCAQLPNTVDAVILFLAVARLGLIISPIVMQYREHELGHILAQTDARAFVTVPAFHGHDYAAMAAGLIAVRPGMMLLTMGTAEHGTDLKALAATADPASVAPWCAAHPVAGGEVLTICWTSGTEARPKGVPRDHNHWMLNAKVVVWGTGMQPGDVLLNPFPLVNIASIGGLMLPWIEVRGTMVLHHPFDLAVFLKQIAAERVTYTIAPPAVLTALLKQPQITASVNLSSLRAIGSGSAPLTPWLIEGWADSQGIEICNIFGSNEGMALMSSPGDVPDRAERAHYFPRFGAEGVEWDSPVSAVMRTRLVDPESGAIITEPGTPGEMHIAGGTVISGYWRSPELNAASFDGEWFRTGDLFEIAGEGALSRFYRFVGRSKEIIVRGGVNISPAEIDELLVSLPNVREAASVGIPDADLGERIAVAVVVDEGVTPPDVAAVGTHLAAAGVAVFKRPERLVVLPALPRNAMNKVVRADLRAAVLAALEG